MGNVGSGPVPASRQLQEQTVRQPFARGVRRIEQPCRGKHGHTVSRWWTRPGHRQTGLKVAVRPPRLVHLILGAAQAGQQPIAHVHESIRVDGDLRVEVRSFCFENRVFAVRCLATGVHSTYAASFSLTKTHGVSRACIGTFFMKGLSHERFLPWRFSVRNRRARRRIACQSDDEGYEVYVVADAVGGAAVAAHEAALRRIEQAGGKMISVATVGSAYRLRCFIDSCMTALLRSLRLPQT